VIPWKPIPQHSIRVTYSGRGFEVYWPGGRCEMYQTKAGAVARAAEVAIGTGIMTMIVFGRLTDVQSAFHRHVRY